MTVERMTELFHKYCDDDNFDFDGFEKRKNPIKDDFVRRDLVAFVKLQTLVPGDDRIIAGAEHDKIWLGIELEDLAKVITEEDIKFLVDCGVFIEDESLTMFA